MTKQIFIAPTDGFNQEDVEQLVIALSTLRGSNGLILALTPADVFQDWFLKAIRPSGEVPEFLKEVHERMWGK